MYFPISLQTPHFPSLLTENTPGIKATCSPFTCRKQSLPNMEQLQNLPGFGTQELLAAGEGVLETSGHNLLGRAPATVCRRICCGTQGGRRAFEESLCAGKDSGRGLLMSMQSRASWTPRRHPPLPCLSGTPQPATFGSPVGDAGAGWKLAAEHCLSSCPNPSESHPQDDFQYEDNSDQDDPNQGAFLPAVLHPQVQNQFDQKTQVSAVLRLYCHCPTHLPFGLGWRQVAQRPQPGSPFCCSKDWNNWRRNHRGGPLAALCCHFTQERFPTYPKLRKHAPQGSLEPVFSTSMQWLLGAYQ